MKKYLVFTRNGDDFVAMDTYDGALAMCAFLHGDFGYNGNCVFIFDTKSETIVAKAEDGKQYQGLKTSKKASKDILENALFEYYNKNK